MLAVTNIIALALTLSCPDASAVLARYKMQVGTVATGTFRLTGRSGTANEVGIIGPRGYRITERTGRLRAAVGSGERAWMQQWDGFVGFAGQRRQRSIQAMLDVLRGSFAQVQPVSTSCHRRQRRILVSAYYEKPGDAAADLLFDATTATLQEAYIGSGGASTLLDDIEYTVTPYGELATSWRYGQQRFRFTNVERISDREFDPAAPDQLPQNQAAAVAPLHRSRNRGAVTVDVLIGASRLRMLLDTGANMFTLNDRTAKRLKLRIVGTTTVLRAGGITTNRVTVVPSLRIGPLHVRDEPAVVSNDTFGYDGLIGQPILARAAVRIDTAAPLLEFRPRGMADAHLVPIDTYDGVPIFSGSVHGREFDLAVDTGAAVDLVLPPSFATLGARVASAGNCLGTEYPRSLGFAERYRFRDVVLAGAAPVTATACVASLPFLRDDLGLLGFRPGRYRSLVLDYARGLGKLEVDRR